MTRPLCDILWQNLSTGGNRDFIVGPDGSLSYREAATQVQHWLARFDAAGLAPEDRVVIRTDNDAAAALGFLAALLDGVVPVMLEGSCPDARLRAIVSMVDPKLVLSDSAPPDFGPAVRSQVLAPPAKPTGLARLFAKPAPKPAPLRAPRLPQTDGLAYLLFTSGTTAAPSGVMISRENLAANLATLTRLFHYDSASRIFNDMILAHADGMIQGPVLAAYSGAAVLRAGGFDVNRIEDWLQAVRHLRASHVITVPTVWSLIDRFAAHDDYFDAPECRVLMTVAAKMPLPLWQRIETRFARPLVNHYGLTETVASALYAGNLPGLGAHGSIGRPIDCEAQIAGGGDEGELLLRGANIFTGYWRNPARTAASFTPDGWFRSGDLARRLSDGSYEVIGRLKSVVVTGGVLIHPDEIDDALLRHPAVLESVTIALPDEVFGEIAVSCVVLAAPCDATTLTEHLRHYVEPRKVSKHILPLPAIPRGLSGKAQLDQLRSQAAAALQIMPPQAPKTDTAQAVLAIAAKVFRVKPETLSLATTPRDQAAWDSFTQLNLVLAVEDHFGCTLPASQVSGLRSLGDFLRAIDAQA